MDDGYLKKPTTPKVCVVCIYIYMSSRVVVIFSLEVLTILRFVRSTSTSTANKQCTLW